MKFLLTSLFWCMGLAPLHAADAPLQKLQSASVEILVNGRLAGSGCVASADGRVLSANHVAPKDGVKLEVLSLTLGRLPAKVLGRDRGHDLLLLALPKKKAPYPHLRVAVAAPKVGERVWLHGAPVFRHNVILPGTIARAGTTYEFYEGAFREIRHIAAMAPMGTSGGPWVNARGEFIGVQSAAMTIKGAHQGIAYSAPWAAVRALLKTGRDIESATMNAAVEEIWGQSPEFIAKLPKGARGLVVRQVKPKGAAGTAGLRELDLILSADGQPVQRTDKLLRHIRAKRPGQMIKLKVIDATGKTPRTLEFKLAPVR